MSTENKAELSEPISYKCLLDSIKYLEKILQQRLMLILKIGEEVPFEELPKPELTNDNSCFSTFIIENKPSLEEYLALVVALAPYIDPNFYTTILKPHQDREDLLLLFGGKRENNYRGILPTGETVQFVVAGKDTDSRLRLLSIFSPDHWFSTSGILTLEKVPAGIPPLSGRLVLGDSWLQKVLYQKEYDPSFSMDFPAKLLSTDLTWKDLILDKNTLEQISELLAWVKHRSKISSLPFAKHIKPGYRALFYGPSGTGKTLTACLVGKSSNKAVYRVDLSMVVSKFIGETEKNLSQLFAQAENKDWILFFDEADALFGKRTSIRDAHDRYANQEVAYLLQRIEDYNGLVILASNLKENIDDAFIRRFQAIIHFPIPRVKERLCLWNKILFDEDPEKEIDNSTTLKGINLAQIAQQYELTGSSIVNIVEHCMLLAMMEDTKTITPQILEKSIKREFAKSGKWV